VDHWILLGICGWSRFSTWLTSALLVFVRSLYLSNWNIICNWILHWVIWCGMQAMYNLPGFWCFLCRFLCCTGMCHWYRCLLLSSMYHSTFICCGGPGSTVILLSLHMFCFSSLWVLYFTNLFMLYEFWAAIVA